MSRSASIRYLNPEELHRHPAFTNVVTVSGPVRMVHVGGQNATTPSGEIVGAGDLEAQTRQVFRNLEAALAAGRARLEHLIKWRIFVVKGQPLEAGFQVFTEVWGDRGNPPLITVVVVEALANPECLVEVEAVAAVPEEG